MTEFRNSRLYTAGRVAVVGGIFAAVCLLGTAVTPKAHARQTQADAKSETSIEGDWVRTDLNGAGDFGGLANHFEKAQLTPEYQAIVANQRQAPRGAAFTENRVHGVGDPYIVVDMPCGAGFGAGALGVNPDSGAIHIIEQKDEVVIAPERGGSRHIFMDGRAHPPLSNWVPTPAGHAVAHYEGKALVVDTVGLTRGGVPAGGYRTPETHLTERFEVSPDGKHLSIKYTYSDPKIYVKPHSYEYTFDRLPAGSIAFEDWCDASDPAEKYSVVPPPQQ